MAEVGLGFARWVETLEPSLANYAKCSSYIHLYKLKPRLKRTGTLRKIAAKLHKTPSYPLFITKLLCQTATKQKPTTTTKRYYKK